MTIQFEEQLKNFKPEFGNINHIKLLKMIDNVRKKQKLLNEQSKAKVLIDKKLKEIEREEKNILYLIKQS